MPTHRMEPTRVVPPKPWVAPSVAALKPNRGTALDVHIGTRLKMRRMYRRVSGKALAGGVGVSVYMLHRWEEGDAHIPAHRLYDIALHLDCHPGVFYDGYGFLDLPDAPDGSASDAVPQLTPADLHMLTTCRKLAKPQMSAIVQIVAAFQSVNDVAEARMALLEASPAT